MEYIENNTIFKRKIFIYRADGSLNIAQWPRLIARIVDFSSNLNL